MPNRDSTDSRDQYTQNVENVKFFNRYQKITRILCVQFPGLILNISENIEPSIYFNVNVSHTSIHFKGCSNNK